MKFLDKLVLKIFSIIILAVTIAIILIMTGIVSPEEIVKPVVSLLDGENIVKIILLFLK